MSSVIWKPIVGYEGRYSVSNDGQVRSERRTCRIAHGERTVGARVLKPARTGPYLRVVLGAGDGTKRSMSIHRLVAAAFVGGQSSAQTVVRHINGNPDDNRPENLAWGTPADNSKDMIQHGNSLRGEKHHKAKLTEADVLEIRASTEGPVKAAGRFQVSVATIESIRAGRNWGWLTSSHQQEATR